MSLPCPGTFGPIDYYSTMVPSEYRCGQCDISDLIAADGWRDLAAELADAANGLEREAREVEMQHELRRHASCLERAKTAIGANRTSEVWGVLPRPPAGYAGSTAQWIAEYSASAGACAEVVSTHQA